MPLWALCAAGADYNNQRCKKHDKEGLNGKVNIYNFGSFPPKWLLLVLFCVSKKKTTVTI